MADKGLAAVDKHHIVRIRVPRRADIERADARVELLLDEILLAGDLVVAGIPAALDVRRAGVVGAGDVQLGQIAAVRQQAHPVGVFVLSARVDRRVAVQDLNAPAEGIVALHNVAALLAPRVALHAAVVLRVFEIVFRGKIEIGVHVLEEERLTVAVLVLLKVEPLGGRAALEAPDVQIAAGLFAAPFDVPIAAAAGFAEVFALDADVGHAVALRFRVFYVEFIADAVFPRLHVVAVGRAAVLGRQLPFRRFDGNALAAVVPFFRRGNDDIVPFLQIPVRRYCVGRRCRERQQ